jgi:hypothetical protein
LHGKCKHDTLPQSLEHLPWQQTLVSRVGPTAMAWFDQIKNELESELVAVQ